MVTNEPDPIGPLKPAINDEVEDNAGTSRLSHIWQKTKGFARQTVVEPLTLLYFTGFATFYSMSTTSVIYKVCTQYYQNATVDCTDLDALPYEVQDAIQSDASRWTMYFMLATLHGIPINLMYAALGDLKGRKVNMMVGIIGVSFLILSYAIVGGIYECPVWVLIIGSFITTFTGAHAQMQSNVLCYTSDIVIDKSTLTLRMALVGACWSLGYVIGGYVAGALAAHISLTSVMVFGLGIIVVAYFFILIFTEQLSPVQILERAESLQIAGGKDLPPKVSVTRTSSLSDVPPNLKETDDVQEEEQDTAKLLFQLVNDIWVTFSRKRPGRRRVYIYLTCVAYFFYVTVDQGLDVVYLYIYRSPRTFTPELAGYWTSANSFIQMSGTLVGAFLFRWLKWTDVAVVLLSMASAVAKVIVLSFAKNNLAIFMAPVAGCVSVLGNAGVEAFLAHLVDIDEVGKVYAIIGICAMMSPIVGTVVYNNVYAATLVWWDGFVFIFVAILVAMSFLLMLYVYVDLEYISRDRDEELADEIEKDAMERQFSSPRPSVLEYARQSSYFTPRPSVGGFDWLTEGRRSYIQETIRL